jgi:anti-anti-sigma regulatory factor/putative methionine-R-sulfoxide reductase with GAF domain
VKTREQLLDELAAAQGRIAELEKLERERGPAEEEARRRAAQAALLYEVGQRVSGKLGLDALFSEIVTAIRDAFDYDGVLLWLVDVGKERVVLETVAGEYADILLRGISLAIGEGMTGQAAATGEAQVSGDVAENPHYIQKAGETTRSELAVPITSGETVIGVLDMQSDQYDAFDDADVMLMETLADQLAVAIENARLYYKVQQELDGRKRIEKALRESQEALQQSYAEVEKRVEERTAELERESAERERLQRELIEAQRQALRELSTPIIPILDRIIVMPLVGSIDSMRARDITRSLLAGIQKHRAKVVILDITGVPIVDSGVADHLNKTIQAARLKGARTMITGISDAVAETIVDLGIDWQNVATLGDLQSGLIIALRSLGIEVRRREAGSGAW